MVPTYQNVNGRCRWSADQILYADLGAKPKRLGRALVGLSGELAMRINDDGSYIFKKIRPCLD